MMCNYLLFFIYFTIFLNLTEYFCDSVQKKTGLLITPRGSYLKILIYVHVCELCQLVYPCWQNKVYI